MKALCLVLMTSAAFCLTCSPSEAAGDGCRAGFVWRETIPQDHVCVPPISRQQAREDNVAAEARVNPTNHDYGPDTCVGGFVWREAFRNDHVCVRPEIRTQSAEENALAGSRVYIGPGGPVIVRPVIGIYRGPGNGGEYYRDRGRFLVVQAHEHDRRGGEHRGGGGGEHRGGGGHGGGGHGGGGHGGGGHGGGGHGGGGHGGGGHGGGGHGGGGHGGGGHGGGGGKHRH